MHGQHQQASQWKQELVLHDPTWGIDVPACRVRAQRSTCGSIMLFFFQKSTTRSSYWINFSQGSMRGAAIWHMWKQQHLIECFGKILQAICQIRSMQCHGDGLYTSLLIKVLTYLWALRMKARREFSQSTIAQIMRHLSRHHDLRDCMTAHFHH